MKNVLIVGGGVLGQHMASWMGADTKERVIGFVDDTLAPGEEVAPGLGKCLGPLAAIDELYSQNKFDGLLVAIGYSHRKARQTVFERLSKDYPIHTFCHSSVTLGPGAKIGRGCALFPNVFIDQDAILGENVLVHLGSMVTHYCQVGAHTFMSAKAILGGKVTTGERVYIGVGVTVMDNISIADDAFVGAGAVVVKNITDDGTYVGVPARLLPPKSHR